MILFNESGRSNKQYWALVRNPDSITDKELRRQIEEVPQPTSSIPPRGT